MVIYLYYQQRVIYSLYPFVEEPLQAFPQGSCQDPAPEMEIILREWNTLQVERTDKMNLR